MDQILKALNGKKTWLGIAAMAVLGFAGDVGWATPEVLDKWTTLAQWLTGAGLVHKAEKLGNAIVKKK